VDNLRHGCFVLTPLTDYAVAIVTGASCGMGREISRALASRGYAVVVAYLRDQGEAQRVVEEILAADGAALAVRADLTDELDAERLFSETKAAFGGVDVVVHTEGRGTSVVYRQAARELRDGGAIINASSSDAIDPELADELRARYITVNGAVPGLEPPGANHALTDLVTFLDRWRLIPGA
jgi:3-oxoacyl-[acyl-carrier protein] reductase